MEREKLLALLGQVQNGEVSPEEALSRFRLAPFEDLGYAKVDHHRALRQGAAEVIYGRSKTPEQILGIAKSMIAGGARNILITRMSPQAAEFVGKEIPMDYHPIPQIGIAAPEEQELRGEIVVASGGDQRYARL